MPFTTLYRCKNLCDDSTTLTEMASKLEDAAKSLREMEAAGVTLDGPVNDDYAEFKTDDADTAKKYGLVELEEDYEDEGDEDQEDQEEEGQ